MQSEASYLCQNCGEDIVVPVDPTGGRVQQYVEDCPVCCSAQVLDVRFEADGAVTIDARAE